MQKGHCPFVTFKDENGDRVFTECKFTETKMNPIDKFQKVCMPCLTGRLVMKLNSMETIEFVPNDTPSMNATGDYL
jgi:hypothetical protein